MTKGSRQADSEGAAPRDAAGRTVVRTVPVWRAWQLSALTLSALSLAGYGTLTSTASEVRRAALITPAGQPPHFTVLLAGRDIAYCYYHIACRDQDSREARQKTRTDTLMLMKVDGTRVNILNIPRDTQVSALSGQKINAGYSLGGPSLMVEQVEEITGERIDYYAVVRTDFVATVINALGGLNVNVPARIDFDDNAADLHVHADPGPQRFDGKQAVAYLRMRKGVGDDYGRMDHQKEAIAQLVDKLRTPSGLAAALPTLLRGFGGSVQTNADPALIQQMVPYLRDYKLSFATLPTQEIKGSTNLMPDREALAALWGEGAIQVAQRSAPVRIFDASGAGLGAKVAWALRQRGLTVSGVAKEPVSGERSQVFTLSAVGSAETVARWLDLPRLQGLRFPVAGGDVGVYLGSDARARYAELARINPKTGTKTEN